MGQHVCRLVGWVGDYSITKSERTWRFFLLSPEGRVLGDFGSYGYAAHLAKALGAH